MTAQYLSLRGMAEYLGLSVNTIRTYDQEGRLPTPDVTIVDSMRTVKGWTRETVDAWMASRPGRGARTDLYGPKKPQ